MSLKKVEASTSAMAPLSAVSRKGPSDETSLLAAYSTSSPSSPSPSPSPPPTSTPSPSPPSPLPTTSLSTSASYTTLPRTQVPPWTARNPHILAGYRPPHLPLLTLLHSALPPPFHPLHNQTANILTHLLPCLFFVSSLVFSGWPFSALASPHPLDNGMLTGYVVAVVACLGLSSVYHMLACKSEHWNECCLKLDYVGITVVTAGSFVPGIHLLFYCDEHATARWVFWAMIATLGALNVALLMHPRTGGEDFWPIRLVLFVLLGNSAFFPILYAASVTPHAELVERAGLGYYYLEGAMFVVGTLFLATRIPESRSPGRHDIVGSHAIFHCFIVAGIVIHMHGLLSGYGWQYDHGGCPM